MEKTRKKQEKSILMVRQRKAEKFVIVCRAPYTKKGKKLFIVDVTATKDDDNIRTVKGLHIARRDEIKIR